ncbi:DsbA family oxidoreductase [Thalassolituus marinus]|uniref:DsbA family oxidoreductase n=1 Tax=Thalassolituus marinus TaxID=671053 RepID=A0ABS7ZR46_9GAMM|nr:DsbA family oxidoreductase [Thalassolituus marinus]MCA6064183.1 DsbA family oxidoreductase [Thalassolituus marinus]
MPVSVRIDIVSDVMCPWCAIGYASLSRALQAMAGQVEADIHWQPFELNPDMPGEGQNLREHLQQKYGSSAEESKAVRERITSMGEQLGVTFNFTDEQRIVNTFSAHQLLHWAGNSGLQTALKMALFNAYFRDGLDVSRHDVLVDIARDVGLDAHQAHAVLADQRYAAEVRNKEQQWQESGIRSVPAIILDQKYLLSGAQPPEAYVKALSEILFIGDEE